MALDVTGFKQGQRKVWSAGDYPEIAQRIESAAEHLVSAAGVERRSGRTGRCDRQRERRAPLRAAGSERDRARPHAGAVRRGPPPRRGRRRDCQWVEGDAEELPYPDDSFDRVLSTFGTMFAPRHAHAAAELVRVCRPGGTIAVAAWTPEGGNGQMFKTVASHMPPPPPELKSADSCGVTRSTCASCSSRTESNCVRSRERGVRGRLPEAWVEYNERVLGPFVMARAALEPQGKWDALRHDLVELYRRNNLATDGSFRAEGEYLVTIARLPA